MDNIIRDIDSEKERLNALENQLNIYYLNLGKKVQEFVESESMLINNTVDEIVEVKKIIKILEEDLKLK